MKQLSKKTKQQITHSFQSVQGGSAAVLCLIASKILRRRVLSRLTRIHRRFGLTMAYRLRSIADRIALKLSALAGSSFAPRESSFFWMFGENPYSF